MELHLYPHDSSLPTTFDNSLSQVKIQPQKQSPTARGGFTAASSWEHGESAAGLSGYVSFSLLLWILQGLIGFHGSIRVSNACMKSWLWGYYHPWVRQQTLAYRVCRSVLCSSSLFNWQLRRSWGKGRPTRRWLPCLRADDSLLFEPDQGYGCKLWYVVMSYCIILCRERGHESHNRSETTTIISSAPSCSQEEATTEKSFNWSYPGPYMPWTIRTILRSISL